MNIRALLGIYLESVVKRGCLAKAAGAEILVNGLKDIDLDMHVQ